MMAEGLPATEGQLGPHWHTLASEMLAQCDQPNNGAALSPTALGNQIVASFAGKTVKRTTRLIGGQTTIIPLLDLTANWSAWLGYREVWTYLETKSGKRRFLFASSDITLFLELNKSEDFHQAIRAEWVGLQQNEAKEWVFIPTDAAHPHWQVDIAELIKRDEELSAARKLLSDSSPAEFGETENAPTNEPCWFRLGRIHFASSMRPWVDTAIAHGPSKLSDIRAWAAGTMSLLKTELSRL